MDFQKLNVFPPCDMVYPKIFSAGYSSGHSENNLYHARGEGINFFYIINKGFIPIWGFQNTLSGYQRRQANCFDFEKKTSSTLGVRKISGKAQYIVE